MLSQINDIHGDGLWWGLKNQLVRKWAFVYFYSSTKQTKGWQPVYNQVAASANYHSVQWMLGFARCISSQNGYALRVQ